MDTKIKYLKCFVCGHEMIPKKKVYICEKCGGNLEVILNYKEIKKNFKKSDLLKNKKFDIWRYEPLLPVNNLNLIPPVQIGGTPLYDSIKLAKDIGVKKLFLKDDGKNPSASFKDRAGAIALLNALENNEKVICGASTGNAASSMACLTATTSIKTIIFVPQTAPKAKIAQLLVFGAKVIMVKGTYDDAFDLCIKASNEFGWYNRNTGYNPYTREGKKTCSFEIAEQLNWNVPDKIFVPVGDGNIISGVWKGWKDLYSIGFIKKLPQIIGCQAQFSNSVQKAVDGDGKIRPVSGKTVADSISVSIPRDGLGAVKAIKESGGFAITVTDKEILDAIKTVARGASIFGEPAGVTSIACLKKSVRLKKINKNDVVAALITGNGLKDVESAMKCVGQPFLINPDLKSLKSVLSSKSFN
ncbi:threonine synthase [Candidatus Dependentiae bacterium]|nr:threonine synthase [Candidatus Dependentiae bacterium]